MIRRFAKWAFPAIFSSEEFVNNRPSPLPVRFKYDAAQTSSENIRHWSMADGLSADGSMTSEIRRTLRNRARYETANNSYARGLVLTLAITCVGTGPRLQFLSDDETFNSVVETEFIAWSEAIHLAEKLQTLRMAKITDGEAFAIIVKNPKVRHPVEIDICPIEADRITSPFPSLVDTVDGIEYDKYGNPLYYDVATEHPGDSTILYSRYEKVSAEYMIHWFRRDRPGQSRGLPELLPALPLFAQLRRYTLAVLAAAETAADFAAVLYTDAPANGEAQPLDPLDVISLEKRMATVMPDGWKLGQIKSEQPATSYSEFKREILGEIGRCVQVPVNILLGDSSKHNYASGRLDHQTFFKSIKVEQTHCEQIILYHILDLWYREAVRVGLFIEPKNGLLERNGKYFCGQVAKFFWDGMEHVDPIKEAKAASNRIDSRISNLAIECAKVGLDWEDVLVQAARERNRMLELGLPTTENLPRLEKENEEMETDESDIGTGTDSVQHTTKSTGKH
ncbi:MAG: phage portal protein [Planctomycetaceae bacterium]|jgi:lambda family phage portal protein|nr:phage portal protein [Planctomycetaceae bacterium]